MTTKQSAKVVLSARDIGKSYGAVRALAGLNFDISEGELVAIVGDNGAGKSTFVKTLAGVTSVSSGQFSFDGAPVAITSPEVASGLGIETVYQDLGLCDNLTVAENIFLGREPTKGWGPLRRIDSKRMKRAVESVLGKLSINVPDPDAKVAQLSGGQRQAVALSRCRLWRQRIAILDEPTAALGVQESARVVTTIRELQADGVAIILVSHDIPMVLDISDRIVVLRKGTKAADIRAADTNQEEVVALITGALTHPSAKAAA
jgi:ABC-type sugar transport system ATPase subunit